MGVEKRPLSLDAIGGDGRRAARAAVRRQREGGAKASRK